MLTLHGKLINVIRREPREGAENKFQPYGQAQFQTEEVLDDGQVKVGLHTLSFDITSMDKFQSSKGKDVSLPVRAYVSGKSVAYAIEAGAHPHPSQRAPQSV